MKKWTELPFSVVIELNTAPYAQRGYGYFEARVPGLSADEEADQPLIRLINLLIKEKEKEIYDQKEKIVDMLSKLI